jgi:long-chain fatty acid transport protein
MRSCGELAKPIRQHKQKKGAPMIDRGSALFVTILISANTFAGGFQLFEQSVKGLGSAFSDQATAADASTVFWNPAGLARLPGHQISFGGQLIKPTGRFVNAGSRTLVPPPSGIPLSGGDGGDLGRIAVIPNLYYSHQLTDKWAMGLGLNSPFGLATHYDEGWIGRYHALDTELQTIDLNPAIAVRLTEGLSLGGGLNIEYAKASLSNAIDFSAVCLVQASVTPALAPACAASGLSIPGNAATDGKISVKGDDWGFGWNLGLMAELTAKTRVGIAYRSRVRHDIQGDAHFTKPAALPAPISNLTNFSDGGVRTSIELPETTTLAVHTALSDAWHLAAAATWTRWSRLRELRIRFDNGAADATTPFEWRDAWRLAIGTEYRLNHKWALRTGIAYDQTPVNKALQSERIPDANRVMLGIGASYRISEYSTIDIGYAHWWVRDASINLSNPTAGNLVGRFDHSRIDAIGLQFNYRL